MVRRWPLLLLLLTLPMLPAPTAWTQSAFPHKAVRIIVPFPPGGSADTLCRIVAERLANSWGQPVVIENRAGAGGNIGAELVYRAEPDGHTLLCSPPGPLAINHHLYPSLPFDASRFEPVTVLALIPNVISARLDLPANSAGELIAYARANPGKLFYASQGNGSTSHLSAEMFAHMAGLQLVHVPYKGEGPALIDLIAGRVDIFIGNIAAAARFEQARQIKFLALASASRSKVAPHVPSAVEIGLPDFLASAWMGLVAPPGTAAATIEKIHAAAAGALAQPEVQAKFLGQGAEPIGESPAATAAFIAAENLRWRGVIRAANIKAD